MDIDINCSIACIGSTTIAIICTTYFRYMYISHIILFYDIYIYISYIYIAGGLDCTLQYYHRYI